MIKYQVAGSMQKKFCVVNIVCTACLHPTGGFRKCNNAPPSVVTNSLSAQNMDSLF
jgi:hypothetical protein